MLTNFLMHVHFPRTGGTSLQEMAGKIPGIVRYGDTKHRRYDEYVVMCKEMGMAVPPSFTFARNPWKWYVSQWLYQNPGSRTAEDFLEWMTEVAKCPEDSLDRWTLTNCAPATYAWNYLGCDKVDYIGRFEDYENEVARILLTILPEGLVDREWILAKLRHRRRSPPWRVEECYSVNVKNEVARWDAGLIERFGYVFE